MLKDRLSFSEALIEIAFNRYIKILRDNLIKGRSIKGFIAAALYSACRELNVPRTLNEIADNVNVSRILARKCYNILVEQLNLSRPTIESNVYLTRAANNAGISKKTLLKAIDIWSKIKDHPNIQGKKPLALSMVVLYYASTQTGEKITKTNMSKSCNMSKVTLNKRLAEVKEILKDIGAQ
jgi:transcription initiation factor TFIIB